MIYERDFDREAAGITLRDHAMLARHHLELAVERRSQGDKKRSEINLEVSLEHLGIVVHAMSRIAMRDHLMRRLAEETFNWNNERLRRLDGF